ncbi:alpha/beta fold hydrolase [Chitinimonas sp. BJB300]|nr:alpha/beta fold hydrolase [Chitinimonas sp. BJB300]PHV11781.1 alpha/beta hydrolase [Chitinimonas sp. BJB300]TSJ91221.1 alpha/beta fold hydrolase [Chitinimonas sp. BJB300]
MNGWLAVGIVGLLLVAFALSWRYWPISILAIARKRAGLRRHSIGVDGFEMVYYSGSRRDKPPMLFLHGFSADSSNWLYLVPSFSRDYRILVPDLPGFGETGYLPKSYALDVQLGRLKDFMDMLHLDRVHLAGNSMGGYLAAAFAATYPERVASLALFNAAGVDMPKRSPFYEAALAGENQLLIRKPTDFDNILKLVYHRKPYIPGFLRDYLITRGMAQADNQNLIFKEMFDQRIWLDERLLNIRAPTLILWGDDDRVLDVSSLQLFKAGIPHAHTAILAKCGHVPMLEKPAATAKVYRAFLAETLKNA